MSSFFPEGLTKQGFDFLSKCVEQVGETSICDLLKRAENHLEEAKNLKATTHPLINIVLAEAILDTLKKVVEEWDSIPKHARSWCLGMIQYFISSDDEEDDFDSPIGFEDDAEVVNACLKLAGREDLCINPEDYDDAC